MSCCGRGRGFVTPALGDGDHATPESSDHLAWPHWGVPEQWETLFQKKQTNKTITTTTTNQDEELVRTGVWPLTSICTCTLVTLNAYVPPHTQTHAQQTSVEVNPLQKRCQSYAGCGHTYVHTMSLPSRKHAMLSVCLMSSVRSPAPRLMHWVSACYLCNDQALGYSWGKDPHLHVPSRC